MSLLLPRLWNWLLRLLLEHIVLVLVVLLCCGAGLALSNMSHLSESLIKSQAVQNATLYTQSMSQAISLYSDSAVERAKKDGVLVTHDYLTQDGAIPLPSTFAIELGGRVSEGSDAIAIRYYSDYPFPWRAKTGGPKDQFEQDALKYLRQTGQPRYYTFVKQDGHTYLRYGEASIMKASCVACHNTHASSPKKDWQVGDVGGVWEVTQKLDGLVDKVSRDLKGTTLMLGGISILGISGLTLVIGKLHTIAKGLEWRVKERTVALEKVNHDLEKRNQLIRQVFGRYLSNDIVATLLENPEGLQLGGERRSITILTSDLRGFTSLSERLQPEEVIHLLNLYLEQMAEVINRYGGTIDEFMGDGILVLFGAPTPQENHAIQAVACACAMQLAMGAVNEQLKQFHLPQVQMGIGIHTGEVVVGNIGSEQRTKYGIVGSPVNLTYRIESYTKGGQILISQETLDAAGSYIQVCGRQQVQPKGISQPITIYEVDGVGGRYSLFLPRTPIQY